MAVDRKALLVELALALAALASCADAPPFSHLYVRGATAAPGELEVDFGRDAITLVEGVVVHARVSAIDAAGDRMPVLRLSSDSPDTFEVERAAQLGSYLFLGSAPGAGALEVFSDGELVGTVPVTVAPQGE